MLALALVALVLAAEGEPEDGDGKAVLFIVVDQSGSMREQRRNLEDALTRTFSFQCVRRPVQVAFFGARGLRPSEAASWGLCGPDAGQMLWGSDRLPSGFPDDGNTPIARALSEVGARDGGVGLRRLLFFASDGEPDCDARAGVPIGTPAGRGLALQYARAALQANRDQDAFDFTWYVQLNPEKQSPFNVFAGLVAPVSGRERHLVVDGGSELNLAKLINEETIEWCNRQCSEAQPGAVLVGNERGFRCSGVALGKRVVLTAAHCLPATMIGIGRSRELAHTFRVVSSQRSPKAVDAALLFTDEDIPQTGGEHIVVTPTSPSGPLVHVGFGAKNGMDFGRRRTTLASARGWGCIDTAIRRTGCNPETEMFLEGSPGHDTCAGDSGGPVWRRESAGECVNGTIVNSKWRLVGVTSRSGEGATAQCGQGSIITRVDVLLPWIQATTGLLGDL